jgi:hypothetical protein
VDAAGSQYHLGDPPRGLQLAASQKRGFCLGGGILGRRNDPSGHAAIPYGAERPSLDGIVQPGRFSISRHLCIMIETDLAAAKTECLASLKRLEAWVKNADWKAYDTFDGLASPLAPYATLNSRFLAQVWQQGVRRFPINLRPLLGIKPGMSTKGMGFFARGYLKLYQTHGDASYLRDASFCLDWLIKNPSPGFKGLSWGNHFDYAHRAGRIAKGTPTIVWTGLIGHAFLDAFELLGERQYLETAQRICYFIQHEIGFNDHGDSLYIHYYPGAKHLVHNSSMIGASLLARVHRHAPDESMLRFSQKAVRWTVRHQLPNGAWYYGVGPKFAWVDSFHTGYVLDALDIFIRSTSDTEHVTALEKGYDFYIKTFFEADGLPRYYDNKRSPLDIQCASQGIETLLALRRLHPDSVKTAVAVARWTIKHMQDRDGHFYYRKYPFITNKTPTLHWGQATMFSALAGLDEVLSASSSPATAVAR